MGILVEDGFVYIANKSDPMKKILADTPWALEWGRPLRDVFDAELTNNMYFNPGILYSRNEATDKGVQGIKQKGERSRWALRSEKVMIRGYVATLWKEMPEKVDETPSSPEASASLADLKRFNCISDVYSGPFPRNASGTAFWAYKSRDIFNVCVKAFSLKMEGGFL